MSQIPTISIVHPPENSIPVQELSSLKNTQTTKEAAASILRN